MSEVEYTDAELEDIHDGMDGSGDEDEPYQVTNVEELQAIRVDVESHYELTEDIDAAETEDWEWEMNEGDDIINGFHPLTGTYDSDENFNDGDIFEGSLSGNDYSIEALHMDFTDAGGMSNYGFISGATDSNIENIVFESPYLENEIGNAWTVGLVVGNITDSTIKNVKVKDGVVKQGWSVGGIVGTAEGETEIINCEFHGDTDQDEDAIHVDEQDYAGGIVGMVDTGNNVVVDGCEVHTNVYCENGQGGGIAGEFTGEIHNSKVTGDIRGSSNLGGINAEVQGPSVFKNVKYEGTITYDDDFAFAIGGILGTTQDEFELIDAHAVADIEPDDDIDPEDLSGDSIGGVVGVTDGDSTIKNVLHKGTVYGASNTGGFVGLCSSSNVGDNISQSGHIGVVRNTENGNDVGGFAGNINNDTTLSGCWSISEIENYDEDSDDIGAFAGDIEEELKLESEVYAADVNEDLNLGLNGVGDITFSELTPGDVTTLDATVDFVTPLQGEVLEEVVIEFRDSDGSDVSVDSIDSVIILHDDSEDDATENVESVDWDDGVLTIMFDEEYEMNDEATDFQIVIEDIVLPDSPFIELVNVEVFAGGEDGDNSDSILVGGDELYLDREEMEGDSAESEMSSLDFENVWVPDDDGPTLVSFLITVLSGLVEDAEDEVIDGVDVDVFEDIESDSDPVASGVTGDDGTYSIEIDSPDEYDVEFRSDGYDDLVESTTLESGENTLDVTLIEGTAEGEDIEVETVAAEDIRSSSFVLVGEVVDMGSVDAVEAFFRYRQSGSAEWQSTDALERTETGVYDLEVTGLDPNSEYEFKAVAAAIEE